MCGRVMRPHPGTGLCQAGRSTQLWPLMKQQVCSQQRLAYLQQQCGSSTSTNHPSHQPGLPPCRLCYLFCRCCRAVSLCPPAYYAHLAALRQRELCQITDPSMSEDGLSTVSGASDAPETQLQYAKVHPHLRASMYYV